MTDFLVLIPVVLVVLAAAIAASGAWDTEATEDR